MAWTLTGQDASLGEDGKVAMKRPGSGIVMAQYNGMSFGHPFKIVPGKITNLKVIPENVQVKAGTTINFEAQGFNKFGYAVRTPVQWLVDGRVGSISPGGSFMAWTAGSGAVEAVLEDVSARAPVTVEHAEVADVRIETPANRLTAGETVQLTAKGVDAYGNFFDMTPEWYLSSPVGTIDQERQALTALHAGKGELRARAGQVIKGVPIEVRPAAVARLRISPLRADLLAGESVHFEVGGFDEFDNRVDVQPEFTIGDDLGQLQASGAFTARKAGSGVVTASVGDLTAESTVAVEPADMVRLIIEPSTPLDLIAGNARSLSVYGLDRFGNVVKSDVTWNMTPRIGTVDEQGVFIPQKAGKGTLVASVAQPRTNKTLMARVPFTVSPGETARIDIHPPQGETVAGDETRFSAVAYDRFGNPTGAPIAWSVRQENIGTISENGVFLPVKAEQANVLAGYANIVAEAEVLVKPSEVAYLKIVPDQLALEAGRRVALQATAEDRFGNAVDTDILWSLSDSDMGLITPEKNLVALKAGSGALVATARNIVDTASLSVRTGAPIALKVNPGELVAKAGQVLEFGVMGYDAGGNPVEITPRWSVNGGEAAIDENGVLRVEKVGTVQVMAKSGEIRGASVVEVRPGDPVSMEMLTERIDTTAGEVAALDYRIHDAYGNQVPDAELSWQVENDLGTVTEPNVFHARKAGEGALRVGVGSLVASVPVTVTPGSLHSIQVEPSGIKLAAGETTTFQAKGYDAYGNLLDLQPAWSVVGTIGNIDEQGAFQATTRGNGYVAVQTGDVTGVATVGVLPGAVAKVDVLPDTARVKAGDKIDFRAVAYDRFGNVVPETSFDWTVQAEEDLGKLGPDGTFVGNTVGEGQIVAMANGVDGVTRVSVEPGDLKRLSLAHERINLKAGQQAQLEVIGLDAYGNRIPIDPNLRVIPQNLGQIQENGTFVAAQAGDGNLVVSARGLTRSIPVEVRKGDLEQLVIKLPERSLQAGKSYDLEAVGYDAGCNVVSANPNWAVTEDVGRIDPSTGTFHAGKAGKGVLVAYSGEGVTSEVTIQVTTGEVSAPFLQPNPVKVDAGTTHQFEIVGLDSEGNRVRISPESLKWSQEGDIGTFDGPAVFRGTHMGTGKVVANFGSLSAETYVRVDPGKADSRNSRIRVSYPNLPADGQSFSEVIVEVRDKYNNPVPGVRVTIVSNRQGDTIVQPPPTSKEGLARGRISSQQAGPATIQAVVEENTFTDTEAVEFG